MWLLRFGGRVPGGWGQEVESGERAVARPVRLASELGLAGVEAGAERGLGSAHRVVAIRGAGEGSGTSTLGE